MANEKKLTAVDSAVEAAGGPLLTAVKCGVSLTSVYLWKQLGRVPQSRHAVLLQRAAREGNVIVAIEDLAGLSAAATAPPPRGRKRRESRWVPTASAPSPEESAHSTPTPPTAVSAAA